MEVSGALEWRERAVWAEVENPMLSFTPFSELRGGGGAKLACVGE
jgi:hypothetical protein